MASQLVIGGEVIDNVVINDDASEIKCTDANGNDSNVQTELNKQNKKFVVYNETIVKKDCTYAPNTTTVIEVPFDDTDKQIHSLEVNSTGWAGVIPQGIYYNKDTKNVVVTVFNTLTSQITANLSVVVRYSLK